MDPTPLENRLDLLVQHLQNTGRPESALDAAGLNLDAFRPFLPAASPGLPYARVLLRSTPEYEIALARWTPDLACAPHDHGVSSGWIFFLQGRLHEVEYRWTGDRLLEVARNARETGTTVAVRADEIHTCAGEGDTLTLHVYFPRSESVRIFDSVARRTLTVAGDGGAWLPLAPEQIRESRPWPNSR